MASRRVCPQKARQPRQEEAPLFERGTPAWLTPGIGGALVKALRSEGLIEAAGRGVWGVTQAGRTRASATAAKLITRATAEKPLPQFLGRVERVNNDPYFLGVTRVVLFGSMQKPEVERLSDVESADAAGISACATFHQSCGCVILSYQYVF